jgi:hypothetical protein
MTITPAGAPGTTLAPRTTTYQYNSLNRIISLTETIIAANGSLAARLAALALPTMPTATARRRFIRMDLLSGPVTMP